MSKGIVVCLCDITGHFAEPWVEFGYSALLVDPQHTDTGEGPWFKFPGTIEDAMPVIDLLIQADAISFVMGFPPCTDVAVSGARWWEEKRLADPYFQARAAIVAQQCKTIGQLSGAPWAFENPVSAFSSIFGAPNYSFDPFHYAALCHEDQYTKQTCLWTGGGFKMPVPREIGSVGMPDDRIFKAPPSEDRANFRSATPRGFARACFLANALEFKGKGY